MKIEEKKEHKFTKVPKTEMQIENKSRFGFKHDSESKKYFTDTFKINKTEPNALRLKRKIRERDTFP